LDFAAKPAHVQQVIINNISGCGGGYVGRLLGEHNFTVIKGWTEVEKAVAGD